MTEPAGPQVGPKSKVNQPQPNEAQDPQSKAQQRDQQIAETRANASQDTSAISPGQFAGDPANIDGVRPATGTPPQVVEAGPGVEIDADLDRAAVQRAGASGFDEVESNDLLIAAQAKAPNLTAAYVDQYGLVEEDLRAIARGEVSPPPAVGPIHNVDLHLTPGGWQLTPVGVPTEDVGKNAISR